MSTKFRSVRQKAPEESRVFRDSPRKLLGNSYQGHAVTPGIPMSQTVPAGVSSLVKIPVFTIRVSAAMIGRAANGFWSRPAWPCDAEWCWKPRRRR